MADYLEALKAQIQVAHMHAIYGGKNPHPQTMIVGGVTLNKDLTSARITEFKNHVVDAQKFVNTTTSRHHLSSQPLARTMRTSAWRKISCRSGEFPQSSDEPSSLFFPRGIIFNRATSSVQSVDVNNITEHITHSWYSETAFSSVPGETVPNYTGLNTYGQYSWIKAPRYQEADGGRTVGQGHGELRQGAVGTVQQVNAFLQKTGLPLTAMYSALGRTAARAIETKVIADAMTSWAGQVKASSQSTSGMPNRSRSP
jgi:[NiFe] hydrogenase large subunit